jgi:hypothetical protein
LHRVDSHEPVFRMIAWSSGGLGIKKTTNLNLEIGQKEADDKHQP